MRQPLIACLLVATLTLGLAGCSSLTKRTKAKGATSTTTTTSPLFQSSRKVQQDLRQTEADLGELESQVKSIE